MVPVVAEPDSHVVSETEATFDESDTDEEELFDDSEEEDDEDEPRAATTGRVTPSPIPAAERAAEAMFGEGTTFDESEEDEARLRGPATRTRRPSPEEISVRIRLFSQSRPLLFGAREVDDYTVFTVLGLGGGRAASFITAYLLLSRTALGNPPPEQWQLASDELGNHDEASGCKTLANKRTHIRWDSAKRRRRGSLRTAHLDTRCPRRIVVARVAGRGPSGVPERQPLAEGPVPHAEQSCRHATAATLPKRQRRCAHKEPWDSSPSSRSAQYQPSRATSRTPTCM